MPNEFLALRARARAKRDKAIAFAKSEYEAALRQIATLEQDLLGKESSRHVKISASIDQVIPSDRPFTTVDIQSGLEALDPSRVWRPASINNYISQLRRRGLVRRLKRSKTNLPAVYIRAGVAAPTTPFEDMKLVEVVSAVLTKPMRQTELVVAMLEAGYETSMNKDALRNAVGEVLRGGRFSCEGGKWSR